MRRRCNNIKHLGGGQKKLLCILLVIAVILSYLSVDSIIVHADQTEWAYSYTKNVQTFTAPSTGKYYIDIYGAGSTGSTDSTYTAGGHTYGYINLLAGQQLYIVTGQHGTVNGAATYNGGGGGGGGVTDPKPGDSTLRQFRTTILY